MINYKPAPLLCVAVILISVGCGMLSPENFMTASPLECKPLSLLVKLFESILWEQSFRKCNESPTLCIFSANQ